MLRSAIEDESERRLHLWWEQAQVAAQDAINALAIGGPTEIEPELRAAALQRAAAFGVVSHPSAVKTAS